MILPSVDISRKFSEMRRFNRPVDSEVLIMAFKLDAASH